VTTVTDFCAQFRTVSRSNTGGPSARLSASDRIVPERGLTRTLSAEGCKGSSHPYGSGATEGAGWNRGLRGIFENASRSDGALPKQRRSKGVRSEARGEQVQRARTDILAWRAGGDAGRRPFVRVR